MPCSCSYLLCLLCFLLLGWCISLYIYIVPCVQGRCFLLWWKPSLVFCFVRSSSVFSPYGACLSFTCFLSFGGKSGGKRRTPRRICWFLFMYDFVYLPRTTSFLIHFHARTLILAAMKDSVKSGSTGQGMSCVPLYTGVPKPEMSVKVSS